MPTISSISASVTTKGGASASVSPSTPSTQPEFARTSRPSAAALATTLSATWRERAREVQGHALDSGHYLPEEVPDETAAALRAFFLA